MAESQDTQTFQFDTVEAIHAPDGLPRIKGRQLMPRPLTFWIGTAIIVVDLGIMPIAYFYAFKYGTSLSLQDNLAIITGLFGLFCFLHYTYRSMKLMILKKSRKRCRPIGWNRMGMLEFFHINIALAIFCIEVELVLGTAFNDPIVELVAMASPTINFYFGFLVLLTQIFCELRWRLPFNMSSTPKGAIWRPALLVIVEDFGAIELSGEREYRAGILARYDTSPEFRKMIRMLSWFWGIGLIASGAAATAIIFSIDRFVSFGIGWAVPPLCTIIMGLLTACYVKSAMAKERRMWAEKHSDTTAESISGSAA